MCRILLALGCMLSQLTAQTPAILHDGTPIRLRLTRTLSSADAKAGDNVDFEVLDEIKVGDAVVIARGGVALGTVTEAHPKRRMGRGGKLNVNIDHVRLVNNEKVALRAVKETKGGGHAGAMTGAIVATSIVFFPAAPLFLFMHGKDITIPKGTEITAYVNGDVRLDPDKFRATTIGQQPAAVQIPMAPSNAAVAGVATQASLSVTSTPPGAEIEMNGRFVGSTPSTLKANPGTYKLAIKRNGFKSWERELQVEAGASVTIHAELDKAQ